MKSGVLSRYKEFLPITPDTPIFSAGEGDTPLVRCSELEREIGCGELYLKLEGCNPTGSFKDRGMVVAVAKALEAGSKATMCASTGNTSASAAAYAAYCGLTAIIIVPKGKIAQGKLAQAIVYGARIVAIDGNCRGYREKRDEILDVVQGSDYRAPVVCAVPDPHIERWYLADPRGFQRVLGIEVVPDLPAYKCEHDHYKHALRTTIRQAGVVAPLGGMEYGPEIAENLDLYTVGRADAGFRHFIENLQEGLIPFVMSQRKEG